VYFLFLTVLPARQPSPSPPLLKFLAVKLTGFGISLPLLLLLYTVLHHRLVTTDLPDSLAYFGTTNRDISDS